MNEREFARKLEEINEELDRVKQKIKWILSRQNSNDEICKKKLQLRYDDKRSFFTLD
ncbi:MAG: hypothetical protein ACN4A7_06660 [Thermacetogeniaceae bacterium]|jgi:hypothetical protein|nr:hypothetical protein [Thermoanaerobacterales bacterium]NLN20794.1 hypothetical protein [Syntrophomonadaceae bacterium]